jgi:hypothetical protein
VATANILYPAFVRGTPAIADLQAVQRRRVFPMAVIQKMQVVIQNAFLGRILDAKAKLKPPLVMRAFAAIPLLRRIPGYVIGIGVRPEHIRTPDVA